MAKQNLNQQALVSQQSSNLSTTEQALENAIALYEKGSVNKGVDAKSEVFFLQRIVHSNDKLKEASPTELVDCFLTAATLGLTFNPSYQFVHLVPYWSSKVNRNIPSLQIGYKGMEYLMKRSGLIKKVIAHDLVYEGEKYSSSVENGEMTIQHTKETFKRNAAKGEVGGYILVELYNGSTKLLELSTDDFNKARSKSKSWGQDAEKQKTSIWATERVAMCKKTLWRRLYSELLADLKIAQEATAGDSSAQSVFAAMQKAMDVDDGDVTDMGNITTVEKEPVKIAIAPTTTTTTEEQKVVKPESEPAQEFDENDFDEEDYEPTTIETMSEDEFSRFKASIVKLYDEAGIKLSVLKATLSMHKNDLLTRAHVKFLDECYAPYLMDKNNVKLSERISKYGK